MVNPFYVANFITYVMYIHVWYFSFMLNVNFYHRYKQKPRMDVHKRENLTIVFQFMINVEKIPLVNIGEFVITVLLMI